MSRIAEVLRTERVVDEDGSKGLDVIVDPGGVKGLTTPVFAPCGYDAVPLPGDFCALSGSAGSGNENCVGFADVENAGVAAAGEARLYARNPSGAVIGSIWLKGDGTIVGSNAGGTMTLSPAGVLSVGGSSDAAALASVVDRLIGVLDSWVPLAQDGGLALKTAFDLAFPSPGTSASAKLKLGG